MSDSRRPPNEPELPREPGRRARGRRLFDAGAAVVGIGAGIAFANPVLAAAGSAWNGFVVPAYQALLENGLMVWCF